MNMRFRHIFFTMMILLPAQAALAGTPNPSSLSNPVAIILLVVIAGLLLAIAVLANVVLGAAQLYRTKMKKEKSEAAAKTIALLIAVTLTVPALAQGTSADQSAFKLSMDGLSPFAFYSMISVIVLELAVIFALLVNLRFLLGLKKEKTALPEVAAEKVKPDWFEKLNHFVEKDKEETIDLGHDYDGIRELDNKLPPWWLYGFYLTILFGVFYLWRYHVAESAPLSDEEFRIEMVRAEKEKEIYLKNAANKVDETNVKLIEDAGQLAAGKGIFISTCAACHGKAGEGGVGPNLTDDFWLHGGSVKDIFKTIKYGVPEKGMKAWQDDFSPSQIAQVSSFIKTLHGTNPPGAKEKQGELYQE